MSCAMPRCVSKDGEGGTSVSPQRRVGGVFKHWTGGEEDSLYADTLLAKSLSISATTKNEMGI